MVHHHPSSNTYLNLSQPLQAPTNQRTQGNVSASSRGDVPVSGMRSRWVQKKPSGSSCQEPSVPEGISCGSSGFLSSGPVQMLGGSFREETPDASSGEKDHESQRNLGPLVCCGSQIMFRTKCETVSASASLGLRQD